MGTTFRLPWGRNPLGWWLSPPESRNSHRVTFWLPDPSAWDPRTPLLPSRGEWVTLAPGPIPGSTRRWSWRGWPSLRSPPQEPSQPWFVAFLTPRLGSTLERDSTGRLLCPHPKQKRSRISSAQSWAQTLHKETLYVKQYFNTVICLFSFFSFFNQKKKK